MAKISHSDAAPKDSVHYTLAAGEFDLGGKTKVFETDDQALIADAQVHPWLKVEFEGVNAEGDFAPQLDPKDDHLSFINDNSNDPEVAAAAEEAKVKAADGVVENPVPAVAETTDAADNSDKKKDQ